MSTGVWSHGAYAIRKIGTKLLDKQFFVPGDHVYYYADESTQGIIISVDAHNGVVNVLWARTPSDVGVEIQEIKSVSRKLNVKWSGSTDYCGFNGDEEIIK